MSRLVKYNYLAFGHLDIAYIFYYAGIDRLTNFPSGRKYGYAKCQVPDEYILKSKRPLLVGREVLAALVADWKDRSKTC